uniref:Immunoglobulin domain-containing protein n=1 Tax=Esox lucius TaxID=8010 RepID=A0A6Q2YQQ4_ESOLU
HKRDTWIQLKSLYSELNGDLCLIIPSAVYNDNGYYECVCDNNVLQDVKLEVLVPVKISAKVGDTVTLNYYGLTDKQIPYNVSYTKGNMTVMSVKEDNLTTGPGFENRLHVSKDAYKQGDLSLTIDNIQLSDQGIYECFFNLGNRGNPDAVILTVKDTQEDESTWWVALWIWVGIFLTIALQTSGFCIYKCYTKKEGSREGLDDDFTEDEPLRWGEKKKMDDSYDEAF